MDFIIFDLEATCFDGGVKAPQGFKNEIIEIGAVKISENGLIIDEFQCFIKPKKFPQLSNFCKWLTSISQKDIDEAYYFPDCLHSFLTWSTGEDIAWDNMEVIKTLPVKFVSWGYYDRSQLRDDCYIHGINQHWIDESNHMSLKHKHAEWTNLKHKRGIGLGGACKFEKIEFEGTAHRGIDDARNIAKIFVKYLDKVKNEFN